LGFKTPNEVFMQSLNRVALRVWIYHVFQDLYNRKFIQGVALNASPLRAIQPFSKR
jgi:hypothetical protein